MFHRVLALLLFCFYSALPCFGQVSGQASIPDRYKGVILYAPLIETPTTYGGGSGVLKSRGTHSQSVSEARSAQGAYRLTVNQKTGEVEEVGVLMRTGVKIYDAAAITTFFRWKFKPGSIKQLDVPVMFSRTIDINLSKAGSR